MAKNFTFSMLKPDVLQDRQVGRIIAQIEDNGFKSVEFELCDMKLTILKASIK